MPQHFLAFDLGASSGRAVLGTLADGRLELAEVHRFANGPVDGPAGSMRWDHERLERDIRRGLELAREQAPTLAGLGVDTWGVDYVLLDEAGRPVEPPFHYRDARTDGVMDRVCNRIGRERVFDATGIQFMPFNTIFQLAAHAPDALARAERLLMMGDWFAHRLACSEPGRRGGRAVGEVTLASTSQLVDPRTRTWHNGLIGDLGLPPAIFPDLVEPGAVIGDCGGVPVVASAHHDTAAAVAGTPGAGDDWAFLSSGTWSLLGIETDAPVLGPDALAANVSNELGVGGTVRLLKNIAGLWLLQECRRCWSRPGHFSDPGQLEWNALVAAAEAAAPLQSIIDPDDPSLLAPSDMPSAIAALCRRTGQPVPDGVGATVRVALESVALKTRRVLELLEQVTGRSVRTIHMVGGGIQNKLLCQWTADATGRTVLAGPVEATATGNILTQAVGIGAIADWPAARALLRDSIELAEYPPANRSQWDDAYGKLAAAE